MGKAGKLFRALKSILKDPSLLNHVLDDNEQWRNRVEADYPGFKQLSVIELFDVISTNFDTVSPYSFLSGGSMPTDLLLLKGLAGKFDECRYFEIGTWRGESVANVAQIADHCLTIDLPETEKRQLGFDETYINEYARFSKNLQNVKHLQVNTAALDFASLGKFDLVFIDGDHHYNTIVRDTRNVLSNNIHEKSIIVWHDYAFHPESIRYETLNAIAESIPEELHSRLYFVKNTLCAVYLPEFQNDSENKTNYFTVKINPGK
jgi:predicted O-methyltransferase YrrM